MLPFIGSIGVAETGDLPHGRFFSQRDGNRLALFITVTGTTASIQPVFRRVRQPGADPYHVADDVQKQYEGDDQRVQLPAAGNYYREMVVPRGMEVGLRVQAIAGGAVSVLGHFESNV